MRKSVGFGALRRMRLVPPAALLVTLAVTVCACGQLARAGYKWRSGPPGF